MSKVWVSSEVSTLFLTLHLTMSQLLLLSTPGRTITETSSPSLCSLPPRNHWYLSVSGFDCARHLNITVSPSVINPGGCSNLTFGGKFFLQEYWCLSWSTLCRVLSLTYQVGVVMTFLHHRFFPSVRLSTIVSMCFLIGILKLSIRVICNLEID